MEPWKTFVNTLNAVQFCCSAGAAGASGDWLLLEIDLIFHLR